LFKFDSETGLIRVAGSRVVMIDTVALGLLRKELIDTLGVTAARALLTRFGFAHGRHLADVVANMFPDGDREQRRQLGPEIFKLEGLFVRQSTSTATSPEGATWGYSYEAEQHILHLGISDEPVCWTLCGLVSGYASGCQGKEMYGFEDRCIGRGDPVCHIFARTLEEFGDHPPAELAFFKKESLDESLRQVLGTLKQIERKLKSKKRELAKISGDSLDDFGMVARSGAIRRVLDLAKRVAAVDSTVLISGETGSGKERVARFIHDRSPRASDPFVAINCAAIPEPLLESELFGHIRGAFTGANQDRIGLFEGANGGTLFLDEVAEISPATQVKLLRAIQEREIRRVGENKNRKIDVRIISATNRDIVREVEEGRFRLDLLYRLRVVELTLPPLRERREDVLPLAHFFLAEASARMKRHVMGIVPKAADQLLVYPWPGNVRELQNAMERGVALAKGELVEPEDLPEEIRQAVPGPRLTRFTRTLEQVEREYILAVLEKAGGNQTHAAKLLDVGTTTLYRKLKAYKEPHRSK
jgi:two-component system response regulator HydG